MGIRDKLIELEELTQKSCTVTLTVDGDLRNGAELVVSNCRCVKNCDDSFMILSVYGMDIRVTGAPLVFENFGIGSVRITGKIHSITLDEK